MRRSRSIRRPPGLIGNAEKRFAILGVMPGCHNCATRRLPPQESAPSGNETILQLATASPEMAAVHEMLRAFPSEDSAEHHEAVEKFIELDGYNLEAKAKRILAGLAFRETDFDRPARTMSGGWIMRAHLARLLVMEPDLLMLDEPTNHLDLETLGWFQDHLVAYSGALLVISHDRAFLNAICDSIAEISRQRLHRYQGNYEDYLSRRRTANNTSPPTRTSSADRTRGSSTASAKASRPRRPRSA